jgi:hypothetical protein
MPAKGYQVALKDKTGNLLMSGPSDADGAFVIPGVPPSSYRVTAFTPEGTEFTVLSQPVTLKAGQMERLELRVGRHGAAPGRAAGKPTGKTAATAGAAAETTEGSGKKKLIVIGIVVAGAFAAAAFSSGDNGSQAPPPTQIVP